MTQHAEYNFAYRAPYDFREVSASFLFYFYNQPNYAPHDAKFWPRRELYRAILF